MSKRPTFKDLIREFGISTLEAAVVNDDDPTWLMRQDKARSARAALETSLRKAGIPLDQVAP